MRSLPTLAVAILDAHSVYIASQRSALEYARLAGELLTEAKGQLPHGEWLPWLESNCDLSVRVAQGYMRIARDWPKLVEAVAKSETPVSYLPIRDALTILADEWTDADALAPGGSNDHVTDDAEDDDRDKYGRAILIRIVLSIPDQIEFRKHLDELQDLLGTVDDADTVHEIVQRFYEDWIEDADDSAQRQQPVARH